MAIIEPTDLPSAVQAAELVDLMVAGANASAKRVAPCLAWDGDADSDEPAPSEDTLNEAKLILVGAIVRWSEAGTGSVQQKTAGPFGISIDTKQASTGYRLRPTEIEDLQALCKTDDSGGGLQAVDTVMDCGGHAMTCGVYFGGACSCGAVLAGFPLYEDVDC